MSSDTMISSIAMMLSAYVIWYHEEDKEKNE